MFRVAEIYNSHQRWSKNCRRIQDIAKPPHLGTIDDLTLKVYTILKYFVPNPSSLSFVEWAADDQWETSSRILFKRDNIV